MYLAVPVLYFALASFLGLVGFNSSQRYRPVLFLSIAIFCLLSFRDMNNVGLSANAADTCGKFIFLYLTHMGSALCVEKYVLESKAKSPNTWDWVGAYKVLYNGRYVGTARQVTDVPYRGDYINHYFKLRGKQGPVFSASWIQNFPLLAVFSHPRICFIRNRVLSLLAIYAIDQLHNELTSLPSPYYDPLSMSDFTPSKETFFRKFFSYALGDSDATLPSFREAVIRTWLVVYFVWSAWSLYTSVHDVLAIIFVGIGLDGPEEWRPIYGSLKEGYSMQRFWSKFWHKAIYRAYTSFGSFISRHVLRLSRRSLLGKIFVNFFVFFLSGLIHAICAKQIGFTCAYWDEVWFFLLNFCAIMVEMPVQKMHRKLVPRAGQVTGVVERMIGYVWVFSFFFWSLPKSQMPKMWCLPAEG